ncbi:RHS repeat domain-containing protein [Flavivirga amylovorans]|uniref:RHS repeat domain-containing protein n=1 Tax=Flavivirga amylovorans TaxID=870486 RepID=A0ABT8X1B5_9FLAO|nr:RHS repeat domain-containing protein [Flavivirga amylovorans]MDO5987738.1 RHS repeat domain-containing protein [Flavivirga amylovorans]
MERQIIPPSPTASALAQYADVPVGYYTGTPNISIPIYEVSDKDISLSISLSYNASGIKVNQEASWVGLGWSLNAGGVITRQVRGLDDLMEYGAGGEAGYTVAELPERDGNGVNTSFNTQWSLNDFTNLLNDYKVSTQDPEPDIFYYNFAGKSGKFYLEKGSRNNGVYTATLEKKEGLLIEYNTAGKYWTIIDLDGTVYQFSVKETTNVRSAVKQNPVPDSFDLDLISNGTTSKANSAWYLNDIKSRSGGHIILEYDTGFASKSQLNRLEKVLNAYNMSNIACTNSCFSTNGFLDSQYYEYALSRTDIDEVYLKEIRTSNFKVEFVKSSREDIIPLYNIVSTFPQKLDEIKILQTNNPTPVKSFILNNDYFKQNPTDQDSRSLRLKLKEIQEVSGTENIPPYVFDYYDDMSLPSKLTYNIDHWGYYNGSYNDNLSRWGNVSYPNAGTLIPTFTYQNPYNNNQYTTIEGANREPNFNFAKLLSLKKIKYPTSGIHLFEYQLNEYGNFSASSTTELVPTFLIAEEICNNTGYCDDVPGNYPTEIDEIFEITSAQTPVDIYSELFGYMPDIQSIPNGYFVKIYNVATNQGVYQHDYPGYNNPNTIPQGEYMYDDKEVTIYLDPGQYRVTTYLADTMFGRVDVIRNDLVTTTTETKKKGSGLRLKKLTIKDGITNNDIIKSYTYDNGSAESTSGILMSSPKYFFTDLVVGATTFVSNPSCLGQCNQSAHYMYATSNSILPLSSSANGSYIGYSKVQEHFGENDENGSVKYIYWNGSDLTNSANSLGMPTYPVLSNGLLSSIEYLDSNSNYKKTIVYDYIPENYDELDDKTIPGFYINSNSFFNSEFGIHEGAYSYGFYDIPINWWKLDTETTTAYFDNGNSVTTKNYERYNDVNKLPEKISFLNSKNETVETEIWYSTSFASNDNAFGGNLLRDAHMISIPLQEQTKINGIITNRTTTDYEIIGSLNNIDLILPTKQSVIPKNDLNSLIDFNYSYENDTGNLLESYRTDGTKTSYHWGYNDTYPVIKAENITVNLSSIAENTSYLPSGYSNMESLLLSLNNIATDSQQKLRWKTYNENLRAALPDVMVTTYTYDPLIGVTSITDPKGYTMYYEYDEFNRLKQVKDADGHILTKNEYNYKQ